MNAEIIINADDFGYNEDINLATIECFDMGALSSATIMPNMPYTDAAVEYALKNNQFSYGVHLTFVCDTTESPICQPELVKSLIRDDGRFLSSNELRFKALAGLIPIAEIELEISAQIEKLLDYGIQLSHIDSHGHLHKFKPFLLALKNVLPRYNISKVRNVQNLYLRKPLLSPTFWFNGTWRNEIIRNFQTTPNFFMNASAFNYEWVDWLLDLDFNGILEVGVHPGGPNNDDLWRNHERLATLKLGQKLIEKNYNLISWKEI